MKPKLSSYLSTLTDRLNLAPLAPVDNRENILTAEQIESWKKNGFLILPAFFSPEITDRQKQYLDELWATRRRDDNPFVIDPYIGRPEQKRLHFKDAPDDARNFVYKLNDVFLESETLRDLVLHPELGKTIRALLGGDPLVFNSLTFERGSQQEYHFDTFYMPPRVKNKMCAAWIALEDCHPDGGLLTYYPGSHRIPPYKFSNGKVNAIAEEMPQFREYIQTELKKRDLQPASFRPNRGDVLIWHAQLFHGGEKIKDFQRTRRSIVAHYFRKQDFEPRVGKEHAPGRFYFVRPHQKVE